MLDSDLAELHQVPTKRLNEAIKRNRARFPTDFMFHLTIDELTNCDLQSSGQDGLTKAALCVYRARRRHAVIRTQQRTYRADEYPHHARVCKDA